jgi:hypothetical protein
MVLRCDSSGVGVFICLPNYVSVQGKDVSYKFLRFEINYKFLIDLYVLLTNHWPLKFLLYHEIM